MVLSLFDRTGRERDGFLRLHDVYNLKLSADLVVLSGCQTALGKELEGEAAKLGTEIHGEERKGKPKIRPGNKPRR